SGDVWGSVALSPDGKTVLAGMGRQFNAFDARTGESRPLPGDLAKAEGALVGFVGSGRLLTKHENTIAWWEWPSGSLSRRIEVSDDSVRGNQLRCAKVSMSPDGRLLVVGLERHYQTKVGDFIQGNVSFVGTEIWDAVAGKRLRRLDHPGVSYPRPLF